jgi:hypothetical protein
VHRTYRALIVLLVTSVFLVLFGSAISKADSPPGGLRWEDSGTPAGDTACLSRLVWSAPDSGGFVFAYRIQLVEMGAAAPETTTFDNIETEYHDVLTTYGHMYRARVAGVDSLGRTGPFSLWTPLYGPEWMPDDPTP